MKKIILGFFLLILSFFSFNLVNADEIKIKDNVPLNKIYCSSFSNCFTFYNDSQFIYSASYNYSSVPGFLYCNGCVVGRISYGIGVDYDDNKVFASAWTTYWGNNYYGTFSSSGSFSFSIGTSGFTIKTNDSLFIINGKKIQKYNTSTSTWQDFFTGFDYNIADFNIIYNKNDGLYYLTVTTSDNNAKTMYGSKVFTYKLNSDGSINKFIAYDFYILFPQDDGSIKGFNFINNSYDIKRVNDYSFPLIAFGYSNMQGQQLTYVKNDGHLYLGDFQSFFPDGGGELDETLENNCVWKDTYTFDYVDNFDYGTKSFTGFSVYQYGTPDAGGVSYTDNTGSGYNSYFSFKNFYDYKIKDFDENEKTGTGIDFLFNNNTYLEAKTAFIGDSFLQIGMNSKKFTSFMISCDNSKVLTLYNPERDKNETIPIYTAFGSIKNEYGRFACGETIYFNSPLTSIKISFSGMRENYKIWYWTFGFNEKKEVKQKICYDELLGYTRDGVSFTPSDGDIKEFKEKNKKDTSIFDGIIGGIKGVLPSGPIDGIKKEVEEKLEVNEIISFYNVVLPNTPYTSVSVPVPSITNTFKFSSSTHEANLSGFTGSVNVSVINKDSSGKNFLIIILAILYIITRIILISFIFILPLLLNYVIDKLTYIILGNLNGGSGNIVGLPVYISYLLVKISIIVGFFVFLVDFINILNFGTTFITGIFSYFTLFLGNYDLFKSIVNYFFGGIIALLLLYILYKVIVKFGKLN